MTVERRPAPCPFCGSKQFCLYGSQDGKSSWCQCDACGSRGPRVGFLEWDEAIAAWNRRAGEPSHEG